MAAKRPLECVEVHPELVFRSVYNTPYEEDPDFTPEWWDGVPYGYGRGGMEYLSFRDQGVEVARAQILLGKVPNPDYGVPDFAPEYVEIAFLEVAASRRWKGEKLGTRAVQGVIDRYVGSGLIAYSEEADAFWDTLGWNRYEHPEGLHFRPLYVRPPEAGEQN